MTLSNVSAIPVLHADYCKLGWSIVPIQPAAKGPTHKHWPERALSDAYAVQQFYDRFPTHNIGLLHSASGTCALDFDHLANSKTIFAGMGIDFDKLMQSAPQIVGREDRGKLLFHAPPHLTRRALSWPKLSGEGSEVVFELRAGNVQDVLPPSIHPDTGQPYRWAGPSPFDGLPDLPLQLLTIWEDWDRYRPQMMSLCPWFKKQEAPPNKPRQKSDGPSVIDAFNEAHNIKSLFLKYGFKQTSKNRFLSPNSTTQLAGVNVFDDGRAYSHHASDPFDPEHSFDSFELFRHFEHDGDVKEAVKHAADLLKMDRSKPKPTDPFSKSSNEFSEEKPLFKRIGLEPVRPPVWLVKNHIEEGTFVMVFGKSGTKKSFLVYDLSCCIATGIDWHGHRVKQGSVLIICGEGHGGLNRRLKGWEKYTNTGLADAPLYGNERPLILTEDSDIEALIAYIDGRISTDGTPALIVVDTLARALGAADERSGADVNKLIVALTGVMQQYKCSVLLVHHTGHSDAAQHRARGASELPAAVDHEFRVETHEEEGLLPATLLTNTKSKDAALVEPVLFDMINVGLEVCDEDGKEIDTLVPELRGPVGDQVGQTIDPMMVVVDEDRRLRRKGDVKKTELVQEVWLVLDGTKKQAQRWVRRAIERGQIDDFPR